MHMTQIQSVLNEKKITFSYTEEDNCGSIDFEHRGLRYHICLLYTSPSPRDTR